MDKRQNGEIAIFAGGCFWCMDAAFDGIEGILSIECGYTGGYSKNPTYEQVCYGHTGHYEAVRIYFDPDKISYEKLLEIFWMNIDPVDKNGQFCDIGAQYKTAIFYVNEKQKEAAEKSKQKIEQSGIFDKPVATRILPASQFYIAESYHQNYHKKYSTDYRAYYNTSGRLSFKNISNKLKALFNETN